MIVTGVLVVTLAFAASPAPQSAAPSDPLAPLDFLVGEWTAAGGGKPGEATASTASFRRELDGRILTRHSHSEYPPPKGQTKPVVHDDLIVVHPSPKGLRASYFDNEGHVIEYMVTVEDGRVTFESEAGPGPRFQLVYERRAAGEVGVTFSIAPPGKPFARYVSGTMRRR